MKRSIAAPICLAVVALLLALPAKAQDVDGSAEMRPLGNSSGCVIEHQDFSDRKLTGIDLGEARLTAIAFDRAGLGVAIFDGAVLTGVSFDGAGLRGSVFEHAILDGTNLQPALLCNTQMPDDEMDNSDCDQVFVAARD